MTASTGSPDHFALETLEELMKLPCGPRAIAKRTSAALRSFRSQPAGGEVFSLTVGWTTTVEGAAQSEGT